MHGAGKTCSEDINSLTTFIFEIKLVSIDKREEEDDKFLTEWSRPKAAACTLLQTLEEERKAFQS